MKFVMLLKFLETSLIGKALNFGFNEYGFESRVSNIHYPLIFLLNHIKLSSAKKKFKFSLPFYQKLLKYLIIFKRIGVINHFHITCEKGFKFKVVIYLLYLDKCSTAKNYKIMSRPGKYFYISHNALKLLSKRTRASIFTLSTSRGVMTHQTALLNKIGGTLIGSYTS